MNKKLVPGLLAALAIGLLSRAASAAITIRGTHPVSDVILAIVIGLLIRNLMPGLCPLLGPGAGLAMKRFLRAGIVLLGLGLSLSAVWQAGASSLAVILVTVSLAMVVTSWLGRTMGISPRLATLIAVGTGICGASAIIATAPVIDASEDDVCYSVAVITVFGILAIFAYPLIGSALALSDARFGTWAGVAIHETAQVIAAGFAYSEAAGRIATVVKLTRTAMLAPLVMILAVSARRGTGGRKVRFGSLFPWFIGGFVGLAVVRSLGDAALATSAAAAAWTTIKLWTALLAKLLIVTAMAGVGLSTGLDAFRTVGLKPLVVGLVASVLVGVASLGLITALAL